MQNKQKKTWLVVSPVLALVTIASIAKGQDALEIPALPAPNSSATILTGNSKGALSQNFATRNGQRINSINDRIKLIQQLIEDEKAAAEKAKQLEREKQGELTKAEAPDSSLFDPRIESDSSPQHENSSPESQANSGANSQNQSTNDSASPGTMVVSEPINPIELANSLFLTGNYSASRKHFEASLNDKKASDPEEEAWLRCLIGCCFRMENQYDKADELFRSVVNLRQKSFPVDYAKWSLGYLQQRRQTAEAFHGIEQQIDVILKGRK